MKTIILIIILCLSLLNVIDNGQTLINTITLSLSGALITLRIVKSLIEGNIKK